MFFVSIFFERGGWFFGESFSFNKEGFSVNGKFHLKRFFCFSFACFLCKCFFFFLQGAEVFIANGFASFFARFVFFLCFVSLGGEFVFSKKIWVFVSKGFNLIFFSGVFFEEFYFFQWGPFF